MRNLAAALFAGACLFAAIPANAQVSLVHHESLQQALDETERAQILRALEEADGVVGGPNGAAARLGVKRTTLHVRMQKLGIRISRAGA